MEIVPAIYILNGHCVALYKGSYEQKSTYYKSPMEMAHHFQREGAKRLHIVDLDGRKEHSFKQQEIISHIIKGVQIPVMVESGFMTMQEIDSAFGFGAERIVLQPFGLAILSEALAKHSAEKIVVEIQAKGNELVDGVGVVKPSASGEPMDVVDFAEKIVPLGVKYVMYKDERSEGTMIHPNYDEVDRLFLVTGQALKIYVSGGIGDVKHLQLLKKIGAYGAVIGKAFFERTLNFKEAERAVS